jgi:predicted porin
MEGSLSFWGIRGEEDIGGGNSVFFNLENFFQPDTGALGRTAADPFFSRNAYFGIKTAAGKLSFGHQTKPQQHRPGPASPVLTRLTP